MTEYIRQITTPAALPWVQRRMAQIEARALSPIAFSDSGEIVIDLRRQKPWRPFATATFAATYRRSGASPAVSNDTAIGQRRTAAGLVWAAALLASGGLIGLCLWAHVDMTQQRRSAADSRLRTTEMKIAKDAKTLAQYRRGLDTAEILRNADLPRGRLRDVARAMKRFGSVRNPQAQIQAFVWEDGRVSVEVRGPKAPVTEDLGPRFVREARPLSPNVWRWSEQIEGGQGRFHDR